MTQESRDIVSVREHFFELLKAHREHFDSVLKAERERADQERRSDREAVRIAMATADKAILKAEEANERRLGLLNEFRQQSVDEGRNYMRRESAEATFKTINASVDARFAALADVLAAMNTRISNIEGRFLAIATIAALMTVAAAIYTILGR